MMKCGRDVHLIYLIYTLLSFKLVIYIFVTVSNSEGFYLFVSYVEMK